MVVPGGGVRAFSWGGHAWRRGMCGKGGACVVKGGMRGKGGACMAKGGMCGKGGHAWQGACMAKRGGMCGMHPPPQDTAGHCAGGTHPTGMHSCGAFAFETIFLR